MYRVLFIVSDTAQTSPEIHEHSSSVYMICLTILRAKTSDFKKTEMLSTVFDLLYNIPNFKKAMESVVVEQSSLVNYMEQLNKDSLI